jgi:hypothetical protein
MSERPPAGEENAFVQRDASGARRRMVSPHRLTLPVIVMAAVAAGAHVMHVVAQYTIAVVGARHLLPRWDLATHLGHGWLDYHLLVTGRIPWLLWDLWLQGYWPPVLSLYQVPFYLVLGGGTTSGLWSAPLAFVLVGVTGAIVMWRLWGDGALLPASIFLALLMSSPFLLAYATVTMTEMLGALGQLIVLLAYTAYRQRRRPRDARALAISLTLLFFIKYNYFVLLVAPLVLYEWLDRTSGWGVARRIAWLRDRARRVLTSPAGALVALYLLLLLVILGTGGFEFRILGQRVSVRSVGSSGHVVLYILLARLWYLHRRRRIDWARFTSADPLVRPMLLWFAVPVTIWLASPYPNHIRDVANLVINRPLGEATVEAGSAVYLDALRHAYFYSEWTLAIVAAGFAVAAVRYRRQPPPIQFLILAIPLQLAAIALHQTRFPRFLLLTVVLLCLAAASEIGRWFSGSRTGRIAAGLMAPVVVVSGVVAARQVVTEERFRTIAFEHYTDSDALRGALGAIRGDLAADDRLVIVGQSNELSPALFRWELGPPSGVGCFPFRMAGEGRLDLALATRVLLLEPLDAGTSPLDVTSYDPVHRRAVLDAADRGELEVRRDMPLPDMRVALRLYGRTSATPRLVACQ